MSKKETQKQYLLRLFHEGGGKLTLKDIMQTTLGCEFRTRMHEMRRSGFGIEFLRGKKALDNTYLLYKEPGDKPVEKLDDPMTGQCKLAL